MATHLTVDLHGPHCADDDLDALRRSIARATRDGVDSIVLALHGDLADPDPAPDERAAHAERLLAPVIEAVVTTHLLLGAHGSGRLVGTAATLLLAADVSVITPGAVLVPFPGASPPAPGTGWLLRRAGVPRTQVAALALAGTELPAEQAQALGLVTQVADDPAAVVREWIAVSAPTVRLRAGVGRPPRDLAATLAHDCQLAALWPAALNHGG
jgi:enoyl-CoA hydratase/carnithine racemase